MIKLAVFDMAGTTIDEQNTVYKALHQAMLTGGYECTLSEVLAVGAGLSKTDAINFLLKKSDNNSKEEIDRIFSLFKTLLDNAYAQLAFAPCQGVVDLFQNLRQREIKIVLNTGYVRSVASEILKKVAWQEGRDFDLLVTASDVERSRPFPDMIELAMVTLDIDDPGVVMKVGDSVVDIEEGKSAKVGLTVGVTTGAQSRELLETAGPDYIFDNIGELLPVIDSSRL